MNFCAQNPLTIIFTLYCLFSIILTKRVKCSSGQAYTLVNHRTWVRTPGPYPFHVIFLLMLMCSFSDKVHHASPKSSQPRVRQDQSEGHRLRNIMDVSQKRYTLAWKSTRPGTIGPKMLRSNLHFGDRNPPRFAISYIIFSFFFISIIILFN